MNQIVAKERDTRIDVFRAIALLTIFVNHVPGNAFEFMTHKNFGFSDAAEAFVLISGIAAGLAYGSKFTPGRRLLTSLRAARRAGVLYVTHMMTTMASVALFALAAVIFARPELLKMINIETIIVHTPEALVGLVTLGHQLGYNNILSMYAVVLLLMPAFLFLGQRSIGLMLAVSGTVWLLSGIYHVAPINYPTAGQWFLNPLSWQFLFVIGMAGMMHVKRGGTIAFNPALYVVAAGYALLALVWVRAPLWWIDTSMGMPAVLTGFDKTYLSVPRLLHVLSLAYLIVAMPKISNLLRLAQDHPLSILGKHSLPIFVAGTLMAMIGQIAKATYTGGIAFDALIISAGLVLHFAFAYYLEWYKTLGKVSVAVVPSAPVAKPVSVPMTRR
ncbi:OpgC family protein [Limoniibacter endophyticus]|uniref:Membrane protein n=1 Tax=Limoniibacter endophyticus TaxID=1565040 RepID=A0A8J3DJ28_9HYPH|nr:OpgC domain-containing protein [Limoniibacter endophyticus]GHC76781.1 membrane protein [Limoniibacter endophyticus]